MLMASLQVLYQCRLLWYVGQGEVSWARVALVLGSASLVHLATYFLGIGSVHGRFSLMIGAVLVSMIGPLFGTTCIAIAGGLVRLWWCVWEVGRCLF